jgi:superoxide dismutase, Cu-Zn family
MNNHSIKKIAAPSLALAAIVVTGAGVAAAIGGSSQSSGPDYVYSSAQLADSSARVHVVDTGNGKTHVTLHVTGVAAAAGTTFGAHVHTNPCGDSGLAAGGHYQDAAMTEHLVDREVWLDFTVDDEGNGSALARRPWSLDQGDPRSVIIHALPTNPETGVAGARLACIDLDGQR